MHERALMEDIVRKVEELAALNGAPRVTRVSVRLGVLSHFTVEHFREHFEDAARGTVAEGAQVDAVLDDEFTDARARNVVLESVDIEEHAVEEART
jgi:hydrogenase nickel incorporation protein HypA/HybF